MTSRVLPTDIFILNIIYIFNKKDICIYIEMDDSWETWKENEHTNFIYIYEETEPYTNLTSTLELPENEQTRYIHPHIEW